MFWFGKAVAYVSRCCAGPSPVVAYHLCGPGKESGEALLKRFKDIRRTLEQGEQFTLCGSCSCKLTNTVQVAVQGHVCRLHCLLVIQACTTLEACERRARLRSTSCGTCTHCSWRCAVRSVIILSWRISSLQKNGVSVMHLCCRCNCTSASIAPCIGMPQISHITSKLLSFLS